jgi:hypothetical protein
MTDIHIVWKFSPLGMVIIYCCKEKTGMMISITKTGKYIGAVLFMLIAFYVSLSHSIAQEVNEEGLRDEIFYTLELDYEMEEARRSSVVYSYSQAASASGNIAPQLSNGIVAPSTGDPSTSFYYSVDYSDSNNDSPATISVYIDDAPSSMTLNSGVASKGTYKSLAYSLDLGTHTYYFSATDGNGGSARLPSSGSTSGPEVTDGPELSGGKVDPASGTSSTKFYYEVIYDDPDGYVPSEIYVYVDGTSSYIILESGVAYEGTYKSVAHLLDSGDHNYYFTATNEQGKSVRLPVSGTFSGPKVNNPPQLSEGNVSPASGKSSSNFYYYVNCYDEEGDSPVTASVYIDSVAYNMTLLNGENDNGTYQYGPQTLEEGSHEYYFYFTDEQSNQSGLPVSGSFTGPVINDPPQLSGGKVDPDSGGGATNFYYYVEYYDKEKDVPKTAYVYIDDVAYVMDSYSGETYNGTYRYGPKMLKAGNHEYYFSFADSYNDTAQLPEEGSYSGPDIESGSLYVYDNIGGAEIILADSSSGYTTPAILSPVSAGIHKVELSKDEYVSFPSYAVVEVIQDQTTEIPFILLPCPAVIALKGESEQLNLLRYFRDNRLYQTEGGREYINLYYLCAAEISLLIMNDPEVNAKLGDILQQLIPPLTFLMQEEKVALPSGMQEELQLLLDVLEEKGSPFLKAALKKVRKDLREGAIFKKLGFEIDGGSMQLD